MNKYKKLLLRSCVLMLSVTLLVLSNCSFSYGNTITVDEAGLGFSQEDNRLLLDENGFDSNGRMVAYFGSPIIDGEIDEIWENAAVVTPQYISGGVITSAKFRALWDDNGLYILAEIRDDQLADHSTNTKEHDSVEIFVDENNNKTKEYSIDDVHFRVNYNNVRTAEAGDLGRFYTKTKVVEDGYIVEARVALESVPTNGKVLGLELQVNEVRRTRLLGTINVFDGTRTAGEDTSKFGEVVLVGRPNNVVMGLDLYQLLAAIDIAKDLDDSKYTNYKIVTNAIKAAEAFLEGSIESQTQIDDQLTNLKAAISNLEQISRVGEDKVFTTMPNTYKNLSARPGTIETVAYEAANRRGGIDNKKVHVYLPYGYYDEGNDTKYNVFYMMHGGGENEDLLFGGPGENRELKRIIDNMIALGEVEPLIVVTPTFYGGRDDAGSFHEELVNDLIHVVETEYRTHLTNGDLEDIKATRNQRAYGGFSMGSLSTWYTYIYALDYVKYFMPLSGDCWIIPESAGARRATLTAEHLANVAIEGGYGPTDYYILSATGDKDVAYGNMVPQIEELKKLTDHFIYSRDLSEGNFYFMVAPGGEHWWGWINQYIYHILPDLFFDEK